MGLDLTMMPYECDGESFAFSHSLLMCSRSRQLFEAIQEVEARLGTVEKRTFNTFKAHGGPSGSMYGDTKETPYGERLQHVPAESLAALKDHPDVRADYQNRAVWAYLECLPPDTKVALYWH